MQHESGSHMSCLHRPSLLYGWMAPQRGRHAGGVRRRARGLGRGRAVARGTARGSGMSYRQSFKRPIASGLRPHRLGLDALRRGQRQGGRSNTPARGATRRICWQAKQVKGGDGGRLVNSLVPAPVHPAWGKGFYRGGFCRHLWNILEDSPGEDRPRRCSSLLPSGTVQPQAPHKVLLLVAGGAGPSLRFRLARRPRQRLPQRVVQPGRAATRDAAHAGGDLNSHSPQLARTSCRGLPGRGRTDPRPGRRAAELPPGQSCQSRQT